MRGVGCKTSLCSPGSCKTASPQDPRDTSQLSKYFKKPYIEGHIFSSSLYHEDAIGELVTYRYDAPDGPIQVWQYAFDLRSFFPDALEKSKGEALVLYHYTNEFCFQNVANVEQMSATIFASLVDERAHFGKGVYATQHEPAHWKERVRVLLNNYSNEDPWRPDLTDAESKRVAQEWGDPNPQHKDTAHPQHRAAFCLPLIVPQVLAYNIFQRQTPDLKSKGVALGQDCKGRKVDDNRDVWVVQLAEAGDAGAGKMGKVHHAEAKADDLVNLLRMRLQLLRKSRGNTDVATLACIHTLARRLHGRGQLDEAEDLYMEAVEANSKKLGDDHQHTLRSCTNLAGCMHAKGNLPMAEQFYRHVFKVRTKALGKHPDTAKSMANLASVLSDMSQLEEAEDLARRALKMRQETLGHAHQDTFASINNVGVLLFTQGKLAEAQDLLQKALKSVRDTLGSTHPRSLDCMSNLAAVLKQQGQTSAAEALYREALPACREKLGEEHEATIGTMNNLANLLGNKGSAKEKQEAEQLFNRALAINRATLGDTHPHTLSTLNNMASMYTQSGEFQKAEPLAREAVKGQRATLGDMSLSTLCSIHNLACILDGQGKTQEAQKLMREALIGYSKKLGENHPRTRNVAEKLQRLGSGPMQSGSMRAGIMGQARVDSPDLSELMGRQVGFGEPMMDPRILQARVL